MPSERGASSWPEEISRILDEVLTDAYGDDEQLWALRQAFESGVRLPADAFVIGELVEVVESTTTATPAVGSPPDTAVRTGSSMW